MAAATEGGHRHEEGGEYSTTFISIRQSTINDSLDEIDLTPPLRTHDYSNVSPTGSPGMKKRPLPSKPTPFQRKNSPGGLRASPTGSVGGGGGGVHGHSSEDYDNQDVERMLANHTSPKPPPPRNSRAFDAERPPSTQLPSKPGPPPPRNSYDPPVVLRPKPPVMKKPTVISQTRPGMYDDPDEIIAAKKKLKQKPAKPSRDDIRDNSDEGGGMYDLPEEGVYNTPEAVYDDSGRNVAGAEATVPPSPKFDDGIYMDSNGTGALKGIGLGKMGE